MIFLALYGEMMKKTESMRFLLMESTPSCAVVSRLRMKLRITFCIVTILVMALQRMHYIGPD